MWCVSDEIVYVMCRYNFASFSTKFVSIIKSSLCIKFKRNNYEKEPENWNDMSKSPGKNGKTTTLIKVNLPSSSAIEYWTQSTSW